MFTYRRHIHICTNAQAAHRFYEHTTCMRLADIIIMVITYSVLLFLSSNENIATSISQQHIVLLPFHCGVLIVAINLKVLCMHSLTIRLFIMVTHSARNLLTDRNLGGH